MDKEERKREMAQAWCDFQQRMMMSNSGCGPMVLAAVVLVCVADVWVQTGGIRCCATATHRYADYHEASAG